MPDTMSIERRKFLSVLGAELVLTPGSEGMGGAIAKAKELNEETEGSIILGQFDNPANVKIHARDGTAMVFLLRLRLKKLMESRKMMFQELNSDSIVLI